MSEKVVVEPMDPNKKNSPIAGPVDGAATVTMDKADDTCTWNDQSFGDGDAVECAGEGYQCNLGYWVKQ